jgi:hypothetical protein
MLLTPDSKSLKISRRCLTVREGWYCTTEGVIRGSRGAIGLLASGSGRGDGAGVATVRTERSAAGSSRVRVPKDSIFADAALRLLAARKNRNDRKPN